MVAYSLFYRAVTLFFRLMRSLIIIRVLLSYLRGARSNVFIELVYSITEPILSVSRDLLSALRVDTGIFDFSPIVAFLIMQIIEGLLGRVVF